MQGIVVELRKFTDEAYASKVSRMVSVSGKIHSFYFLCIFCSPPQGNMGYVLTVSFGKAQIIHEIAYAPFSSSLLASDVFLLDVEEVQCDHVLISHSIPFTSSQT